MPRVVFEITQLLVVCIDCEVTFYESADTHMAPVLASSTRPFASSSAS